MATTNINTSAGATSKNVLIPTETHVMQSGPVEFTQSNQEFSNSGRISTNCRLEDIVGFPQANIKDQLERWVYLKDATWTSTMVADEIIAEITSAEMYSAVDPFTAYAQYYRLHRFAPEMQIVLSGNAAMVGQAVATYIPLGVKDKDYVTWIPAMFSYGLFRPAESTGIHVAGNYVKHTRAEDITLGHQTGKFKVNVLNPLVAPAGVTATVTLSIWVRFKDVALHGFIPPTALTSFSDIQKRLLGITSVEKQKLRDQLAKEIAETAYEPVIKNKMEEIGMAIIAGGSTSRTASDIFANIGKTVGGLGSIAMAGLKLLPFFHSKPHADVNEWAVSDIPKTVRRVQFLKDQVCYPDQTLVELGDAYGLMDCVSLLKLPALAYRKTWKDTDVAGTELARIIMCPKAHPFYNDVSNFLGSYWRGEVKVKIQFVKTVFHKGQVRVQLLPRNYPTTVGTSNFAPTDVVNIADADTHEVTLPWCYNTDYLTPGDVYTPFQLVVIVSNPLQSVNTTTSIAVNLWIELGHDAQFIGGPNMLDIFQPVTGNWWKGDKPQPIETAVVAGVEDPIESNTLGSTDTGPQQQQGPVMTQAVPEKQSTFEPTQTNKPDDTVPMFGVTEEEKQGWSTLSQTSLKLSSHRPAFVAAISFADALAPVDPDAPKMLLFKATQTDLLRCLVATGIFAYVSGGIRLRWIASVSAVSNAILICKSYTEDDVDGTKNLIVGQSTEKVHLGTNPTGSFSIPWMQRTSGVPINARSVAHAYEYNHTVELWLDGNITSAFFETHGILYLHIEAEDDFCCYQPVSTWTLPDLRQSIYSASAKYTPPPAAPGVTTEEPTEPKEQAAAAVMPKSRIPYKRQEGKVETIFRTQHIKLETAEVAGQETTKAGVFLVRTEEGLETKEFTPKLGFLAGCDTRYQFEADWSGKRYKHGLKVGRIAEVYDSTGTEYIHVHTTYCCAFMKRDRTKPLLRHVKAITNQCKEFSDKKKYRIEKVPRYSTQEPSPRKTRVYKQKNRVTYYTKMNNTIFETNTRFYEDPRSVWGALAETASIWDSVKSMASSVTSWPGKVIDQTMHNAVKNATNEMMQTFKGRVAISLGYTTKGELDTLAAALVTKGIAYTTQIMAANSLTAWIAVVMHLIGDLQIVLRGMNLAEYLISVISQKVTDIVSLFWSRDEGTQVAGEEDEIEVEEEEKSTWLSSLKDIFVHMGESIYGFTFSSSKLFFTACKTAGLLGTACRGIQAVLNAFKAFFQWIGLIADPVQEKIRLLRSFCSRTDVQVTFQKIPLYLSWNTHSFSDHLEEVHTMRGHCFAFKQVSTGITDPDIITKRQQCVDFLTVSAPMGSITEGVKDFEPVFVLLEGPPGKGKSLLAIQLAKAFTKALGRKPDDFFATQIDADFFTGYSDQPVIILDDLFQDPKGEKVAFLTQLISSVKTPLAQADIDSKGCQSCARFIIATTNSEMIKDVWLTDPEAIKRRVAQTSYKITSNGGQKILYSVEKHGMMSVRNMTKHVEEHEFTPVQIAEQIWTVYQTKWARHEELKNMPVIDLPPAQGTSACPGVEVTRMKRVTKMPVFIPNKIKIDMTFPEPWPEEKWNPPANMNIKLFTAGLMPEAFGLVVDDLGNAPEPTMDQLVAVHQLELPLIPPVWGTDYYEMCRMYGFPCTGLPSLYSDEKGAEELRFDKTDEEMKRDLSKMDTPTLTLYLKHLSYHGITNETLSKWLPCESKLTTVLDRLQTKVGMTVAICTTMASVIGVIAAAYAVSRLTGGEAAAVYNPAGRALKSRLPYALKTMPQQARRTQAVVAGAEDKEPVIMKSIVKWRIEPTIMTPGMTVNGVLIGGGCLITVAHAVRPGFQHTVIYTNNVGQEMEFPILVTPCNVASLPAQDGYELDLSMVYLGACFPNTRNIMNYFITDESLETLSDGPARVFYKQGKESVVLDVEHEYDVRTVNNTKVGKTWKQQTLVTHFSGKQGCCGSLLMTLDKNRDARIIGLANATNTRETYFVPLTQQMLQAMKTQLEYVKTNIMSPPQESELDDVAFVACEEQFKKAQQRAGFLRAEDKQPEIPKQPVHAEVKHLDQKPVGVQIKTAYQLNPLARLFPDMDPLVAGDFECGLRQPALNSLGYVQVPFGEVVGESDLPGHQFYVTRNDMQVDGLLCEMTLTTVSSKLHTGIGPTRLLTEEEILNGYEKDYKGRVITNKGFPTNTAIGHTSKEYGLGTKKADMLVTDSDGVKHLKDSSGMAITNVEMLLEQGKTWSRVVEMHLKDELRPEDKLKQGAIRMFYIEDAIFVYLATKYFGDFLDAFRSLDLSYWHTLGHDPVQLWHGLSQWMPEVMCGDCKNWDMTVQGPLLEMVRIVIEDFYQQHEDYKPEDSVVRLQLLRQINRTITGFAKHQFYSSGMKSGMYCTTEINSLMQIFVTIYGIFVTMQKTDSTLNQTMKLALEHRFVVNGDDNMHGKPKFCSTEEYAKGLLQAFEDFGLLYTRADKQPGIPEFVPIEDAEYLKRSFVYSEETKCYHPRISPTTISGLVTFFRRTTSSKDNMVEALVFARQGRNRRLFKQLKFMTRAMYGRKFDMLWTWEWCQERYNATETDLWTSRIVADVEIADTALFVFTSVPATVLHEILSYPAPMCSRLERRHFFELYAAGRITTLEEGENREEKLDELRATYPVALAKAMSDAILCGMQLHFPTHVVPIARTIAVYDYMRKHEVAPDHIWSRQTHCALYNYVYHTYPVDWEHTYLCLKEMVDRAEITDLDRDQVFYTMGLTIDEVLDLDEAYAAIMEADEDDEISFVVYMRNEFRDELLMRMPAENVRPAWHPRDEIGELEYHYQQRDYLSQGILLNDTALQIYKTDKLKHFPEHHGRL